MHSCPHRTHWKFPCTLPLLHSRTPPQTLTTAQSARITLTCAAYSSDTCRCLRSALSHLYRSSSSNNNNQLWILTHCKCICLSSSSSTFCLNIQTRYTEISPPADAPVLDEVPEALLPTLRKYQLQAVRWMLDRERHPRAKEEHPLWTQVPVKVCLYFFSYACVYAWL